MSGQSKPSLFLAFSRPFTLVAPALGFASGAATAAGAAPRESWSIDLVLYPLVGLLMAAVLNAASTPPALAVLELKNALEEGIAFIENLNASGGIKGVPLEQTDWRDKEYQLTAPLAWDPKHYDSLHTFYGKLVKDIGFTPQ